MEYPSPKKWQKKRDHIHGSQINAIYMYIRYSLTQLSMGLYFIVYTIWSMVPTNWTNPIRSHESISSTPHPPSFLVPSALCARHRTFLCPHSQACATWALRIERWFVNLKSVPWTTSGKKWESQVFQQWEMLVEAAINREMQKRNQQGFTLQYSNMLELDRNSLSNRWSGVCSCTQCLSTAGSDHIPTIYREVIYTVCVVQ